MKKQTLYRMYDSSDRLLYVGVSMSIAGRLGQHRSDKNWWNSIDTIKIEHFDTREAVLAAEKKAIQTEAPLHNIQHNKGGLRSSQPTRGLRFGIELDDIVCLITKPDVFPTRTHIGLVIAADDLGVLLLPVNWLAGQFAYPAFFCPWSNIDGAQVWPEDVEPAPGQFEAVTRLYPEASWRAEHVNKIVADAEASWRD